eukprot:356614-Chlamydomonas_euryale.AAC.2
MHFRAGVLSTSWSGHASVQLSHACWVIGGVDWCLHRNTGRLPRRDCWLAHAGNCAQTPMCTVGWRLHACMRTSHVRQLRRHVSADRHRCHQHVVLGANAGLCLGAALVARRWRWPKRLGARAVRVGGQ